MANRFRQRRSWPLRSLGWLLLFGGTGYGVYYFGFAPADKPAAPKITPTTVLTSNRPESPDAYKGLPPGVTEKGADPQAESQANLKTPDRERGRKLLESGRAAAAANDFVTARAQLNEALDLDLPVGEAASLRGELTRLANETIFSPKSVSGDPLVSSYMIAPGDTLAKVAAKYKLSPGLLARINEITDPNVIRAGRRLKVVNGPFHVVVTKADYRLDVYLQDTFVRHYRVGLGADDSTPKGQWIVTEKLVNPTYYPPRGGKVIAADDPENPLGERWVGLEGVAGDAVGQERYGIHGTIEPQSIGTSTTLGCVRLFNEDVEFLYDLLIARESKVLIR